MCFIGFRCGPISVVSSFSRNCLYTLTTRGRAMSCCYLAWRGLCVPPGIGLLRPSLAHHHTGHAEWCYWQHNVLHSFFRAFYVCHMCSSVKTIEHQWWISWFYDSLANASQGPLRRRPCRGHWQCPALLQYLCVSYNLLHVLETVLGDTTNLLAVKLSDVPSWRSWSTCPGSIGSTVFYWYWHWPQPNAMLVKKKTKQSKKMKREKCNWPPLVQPLLFWVCLIVASPFVVVVKWGCAGWWRTQGGQAGSE